MAWTDERVKTLKKLWCEGLSASQIAGRLGSVTRNAVIAKAHRLQLASRAKATRQKGTRTSRRPREQKPIPMYTRRSAKVDSGKPKSPTPLDAAPAMIAAALKAIEGRSRRIAFADLDHHHCRWPIGDPRAADFCFCGIDRAAGGASSYCDGHAAIAAGVLPHNPDLHPEPDGEGRQHEREREPALEATA